jgi:hypothetical protein
VLRRIRSSDIGRRQTFQPAPQIAVEDDCEGAFLHEAVLSSCAGPRKSCQPDANGVPDPPKARAISFAVERGALLCELDITRFQGSDDLLAGSVQRRSG